MDMTLPILAIVSLIAFAFASVGFGADSRDRLADDHQR
jgi:hypothetical protein